jgi:hypothetical protein
MRYTLPLSGLAGFALTALAASATTNAERTADAVYGLSIAGIPIGSASLSVSIEDERYVLDGAADVGFLFWGGEGNARAVGAMQGGTMQPTHYRLAYQGVSEPGGIEIAFADGRAVHWERQPEPDGDWVEEWRRNRIAVEDHHLAGVLDPLSALVIPMPADADPATVCRRLLPVFSGYTRFDLELTGIAAAPSGVGCTARYHPVAGHRPDSDSVARMTRPGAFEIALAPITEAAWGPARVAVQTRFGTFEMVRER